MQVSPSKRHRAKFATAMAMVAGYLTFLAVSFGGVAWALLWPAVAFGAVSLGYAGLGHRIFAKSSGRVPWPRKVLLAPWLALQSAVWWAQGRVSSEAPFHDLGDHYLGRHPRGLDLPDDVDLVVDLTAEFDAPWLPSTVRYRNVPVLDACGPELEALDDLVAEIRAHPGKAYIHCASGHGRSGTLCAALLLAEGDATTIDEAQQKLRQIRPGVGLSVSQRRTLTKWMAARR